MPDAFTSTPVLCRLDAGGYSDTPALWISLGDTATLDAFAKLTRTDSAASRFRLNLIIETNTAFIEQSWAGRILKIGHVECEVIVKKLFSFCASAPLNLSFEKHCLVPQQHCERDCSNTKTEIRLL